MRCKSIIEYFLKLGLNINLYGFGLGEDTILCAHWLHNPDFMKFLIEKGADVNQNSFLTGFEIIDYCLFASSTYDYVETDLAIGEDDTELLKKEEKILEDAGIKYWADGWNLDKASVFFGKLEGMIIYE